MAVLHLWITVSPGLVPITVIFLVSPPAQRIGRPSASRLLVFGCHYTAKIWRLSSAAQRQVDPQYPGTAVERLQGIHLRVKTLSKEELSGDWQETLNSSCGHFTWCYASETMYVKLTQKGLLKAHLRILQNEHQKKTGIYISTCWLLPLGRKNSADFADFARRSGAVCCGLADFEICRMSHRAKVAQRALATECSDSLFEAHQGLISTYINIYQLITFLMQLCVAQANEVLSCLSKLRFWYLECWNNSKIVFFWDRRATRVSRKRSKTSTELYLYLATCL